MGKKNSGHYCKVGGQAVLEGIMMKKDDEYSVAVRKADGKIEVIKKEYKSKADKKWKQLPFIRGVFNFVDSMILGTSCLNYSATFYEEAADSDGVNDSKFDKAIDKMFGEKAEEVLLGITVAFSLVLAIGLFMLLPYFLAGFLAKVVANETLLALFEGLIRLVIFLIYIVAITMMKDIHRLYQYHGAEHKCINCIEHGKILNVENVRKSSRFHKRCGTSFLILVMLVSIILFFFIRVDQPALRLLLRILLIPVIAGISYELIRLAGRSDNIFVRIISAPGMWIQRLTTKEPDDEMIEVAISAVNAVFDWKEYFKEEFNYDPGLNAQLEEHADDESVDVEQLQKLMDEISDETENAEVK